MAVLTVVRACFDVFEVVVTHSFWDLGILVIGTWAGPPN
jgi:hypothetical protein